jgi:hypothetical protein
MLSVFIDLSPAGGDTTELPQDVESLAQRMTGRSPDATSKSDRCVSVDEIAATSDPSCDLMCPLTSPNRESALSVKRGAGALIS